MSVHGRSISGIMTRIGTLGGLLAVVAGAAIGDVRDPFPTPRPATRAAAVALVAGGETLPQPCLTPKIQALQEPPYGASPTVRRALFLMQRQTYFGSESVALADDGTQVLFTSEASAFDRIAPADVDDDGRPDLLEQVVLGLDQARGLLVDGLQLPSPTGLQVLLLELGPDLDGYLVASAGQPSRTTIVLDASPGADSEAARRAAIHQYAHAVALSAGPRFPKEWGEALATWATLTLDGPPDEATAALLSKRVARLDKGLMTQDLELAAGNALWLAFLDQAYGPAAVRVSVEELAKGGSPASALDRALGRVSSEDLISAFREFHLWTMLVGRRADRFHFSFAAQLADPGFASTAEGLPALSVQADPAVASWGATQIRIRPDSQEGGLQVRFEGEFTSRWEADLILLEQAGNLRRLPIELTTDGHGEATVPLGNLDEVLLLVRNLGSEDGAPRRYTYALHREPGYPFDLAVLEASPVGDRQGVDVAWETTSEQQLIGFNILRVRKEGGPEVIVNPVWIPALGDPVNSTSYHYLDGTADPGTSYIYRIQGITKDGLTSLSHPVVVRRPPSRP